MDQIPLNIFRKEPSPSCSPKVIFFVEISSGCASSHRSIVLRRATFGVKSFEANSCVPADHTGDALKDVVLVDMTLN